MQQRTGVKRLGLNERVSESHLVAIVSVHNGLIEYLTAWHNKCF